MASRRDLRMLAIVALSLTVVASGLGNYHVRAGAAAANSTKLAVVVGGPHPYFAPMPGAMQKAQKDFGISSAAYRVPPAFQLNDQNQVIESMVAAGFNAFAIYPDDVNGTNATIAELMGRSIPVAEIGACTSRPNKAKLCIATDVYKAPLTPRTI